MLSFLALTLAAPLTLSEVSKHATGADCWMVIDGTVYDVTAFVEAHPGGPAIVGGCGKDASELFHTRPMGSGTDHEQDAKDMLPSMALGRLVVEVADEPKERHCMFGKRKRKE